MFKKENLLLLFLSTILTLLSIAFLPPLLFSVLPPSMQQVLDYQSLFMFSHLTFPYLLTACLYWIAGSFIGIKAKDWKDALIKAVYVGLGLFFSLMILGLLFFGFSFFEWTVRYFLFTLPGIAAVIIPAFILCILHTRIKLNSYILLSISSAIIIVAYILLSGVYTDIGENTPEIDFMRSTPMYNGVKKQIVEDSQFQLERDLSSSEEKYLGFGSFPAISYHQESDIMVSEFCHQHLDSLQLNEQYSIMQKTSSINWIDCPVFPLVNNFVIDIESRTGYTASHTSSFRFRFEDFTGRPVDIVILPGITADSYPSNAGETVEITAMPIALDALVFIVHKDNPVDNLSTEQLRDIYAGRINNWQDIGGDNNEIKTYQRRYLGYTHKMMEEMVMKGTSLITPIQVNGGLGDMVEAFYQNYPESIGYCLLSFFENDGYGFEGEMKILSIDGVKPDEANIYNGKYPFVTNYYAAIRKGEEDSNGGRFLEWILSDEGQACIRQAGYLPIQK